MVDWIGLGGLVLLLLVISLYGLIKDKGPHSMNPRPFVAKEQENWLNFCMLTRGEIHLRYRQ